MEMYVKLINIAAISLAVFTFILTIVFFIWWAFKDSVVFGQEKFDQAKWMQSAATIDTECKRGDMAYYLQQRVLVRGFPRDSVSLLLGRPSFEEPSVIEYDLGKCMHVYHGLRIFFDENNRVMHSRISSH
jgi:hypothetical protein